MLKLNRRVAALRPSATLAADQRAKEMRAAGIDVISLDAGEPDFDTPERIKDAARKALAAGKTKYTAVAGVPELKEAIRAKLKRDNHLDYEPAEIIASAGCKQALSNVIAAMFDEGDEVIIPTPAWVSFSAMVDLSGAKPVQVRAREDRNFQLTPDALSKAITPRTRAVLINSPSNPTGTVYSAGPLAEIAQVIQIHPDIWVLSDDTYEHIAYDGPAPHIFQIEPRLKSRGILFNSLSKTYAMTGWRVGFAAGPKEVIGAAGRLQSQNSGNPNSIAQAAAVEALNGPQDDVKVMAEEFRKRRQLIVERVRAVSGLQPAERSERRVLRFSECLGAVRLDAQRQEDRRWRCVRQLSCSKRRRSRPSAATISARPSTFACRTRLRRRRLTARSIASRPRSRSFSDSSFRVGYFFFHGAGYSPVSRKRT